ncbi:hypothetical protein EMPS_02905 [Entomortierella parvispora]|uniref:C3H1-type domain-containing protein n=1 Tax=Entomortierella parvispora TaxID=205924 RepID=A0A9P3LTX6_9FUNG|nr:hypothetical protein EMPS_02905 [Entomortierella parvispora]
MPAKGKTHAKGKARPTNEGTPAKDKGETPNKEHAPAPLDAEGKEICFLFLKYGKCRYGKKCKKSHNPPDPSAHLQKMISVVPEPPESAKVGPKLTFTISRTPYSRQEQQQPAPPSTASGAGWIESPGRLVSGLRPKPMRKSQKRETSSMPAPSYSTTISKENTERKEAETHISTDYIMEDATESTIPDITTHVPEATRVQPVVAMTPAGLKRTAKAPSKQLLSALFRTFILPEQLKQYRKQKSSAMDPRPAKNGHSKVSDKSNSRSSKHQRPPHKMAPKTALPPLSSFESNSASISGEKIEQWYITNKAQLDHVSKRLMILKKPTTPRQKFQLKTMRKHHWECKTEVEQLLDRNRPTSFALRVARDRIDWDKFGPYVALMLQAAFDKDLGDPHLPIIAATLSVISGK